MHSTIRTTIIFAYGEKFSIVFTGNNLLTYAAAWIELIHFCLKVSISNYSVNTVTSHSKYVNAFNYSHHHVLRSNFQC